MPFTCKGLLVSQQINLIPTSLRTRPRQIPVLLPVLIRQQNPQRVHPQRGPERRMKQRQHPQDDPRCPSPGSPLHQPKSHAHSPRRQNHEGAARHINQKLEKFRPGLPWFSTKCRPRPNTIMPAAGIKNSPPIAIHRIPSVCRCRSSRDCATPPTGSPIRRPHLDTPHPQPASRSRNGCRT